MDGASKSAFCAASALRASGAHVAALAAEGTAALANQLKMNHYSGSPGVLQSQRAILSSVKMWNVSSSLLEEPCWHCGKGPTWVRASFKWQDKHVEFHSLTVDEAGNISAQPGSQPNPKLWMRTAGAHVMEDLLWILKNIKYIRSVSLGRSVDCLDASWRRGSGGTAT
ncbi:unnamed protein product [Effrenium voratum]|uniref:Uncharacterized protein n=1 Tax=Effrenium voratum TaxID=2562239 RepID=A0AA36NCS9_9DINO|nr:unnamed protein product [Effrenium voratum]